MELRSRKGGGLRGRFFLTTKHTKDTKGFGTVGHEMAVGRGRGGTVEGQGLYLTRRTQRERRADALLLVGDLELDLISASLANLVFKLAVEWS